MLDIRRRTYYKAKLMELHENHVHNHVQYDLAIGELKVIIASLTRATTSDDPIWQLIFEVSDQFAEDVIKGDFLEDIDY